MAAERELRDKIEALQAELSKARKTIDELRAGGHASCEVLAGQLRDQRDDLIQEISRYQVEAKSRRQQVSWLRDELAAIELERRKLEAELYARTDGKEPANRVEEFFLSPLKR